MRERKDVYKLPAGDQTLDWYAKAVAKMQALPQADPRSWHYQAAVHGINPLPPAMAGLWAECQHATSFFLPWHRMYVLNFERTVAQHITDLGGPPNWALPYWNYTTSDPTTLALPPAFQNKKLPNGVPNPLFVAQRNPKANTGGAVLEPRDVALNCLRASGTTNPGGFFGGPPLDHSGHLGGAVELTPHNAVHRQVGAAPGAWMADPDLAALDPIFWLHHSNIDRLWEVWRDCDPATHQNLTSAYWLSGVTFQLHDATGALITMRTADVLNISSPQLDYKYSDASCPVPFKVQRAGVPTAALTPAPSGGGKPMAPSQPELVGATLSATRLSDQVAHVSVPTPITPSTFHAAAGRGVPPITAKASQLVQHVSLHLEQVTSSDVAPTYDVFVNVPDGEDPNKHDDRFIGRVAMFGIKQASDPRGAHGGGGQNFAFDITELYHQLHDQGEIDPKHLKVSFVPVSPIGKPQVTVGRISLYFA
ncbi:MAG TPA: tyrosinase family protein [Gemmataceae bacterium]|jgi:tyrosinase|nr:tyrosinase family protein [Gemmataceae bacterium]